MADRVLIFWDNSNIFIAARNLAEQREGPSAKNDVRIQFDNLVELAVAGRSLQSAICVGSVPPVLQAVWDRLRSTGVAVETYERGSHSGKEQGVDQCLQIHMLRALADVHPPATAVLLTGDGAGYETGAGFHADLERLHKRGWGIEVLSWDAVCNKRLKTWAEKVGVYVALETYYDSITFREAIRTSRGLPSQARPIARPQP